MKKTLAILLVLAAAGGLAYVATDRSTTGGGRDGRGAVSRPGRAELLQQMLDRRAKALAEGDAAALARTATGSQRARDRRAARRIRGLGVRKVELLAEGGDLRANRLQLRARLSYAVRGISGRFAASLRLGLQWNGKEWRVRSTTARRGRVPWEVTALRRIRSPRFVVWAPRDIDTASAGLTDALESGYAKMRDVLARGRLRRRYLVVVAGDAGQARALTASIRGIASLAAITDTEVRQEGPAEQVVEVASQRLLVIWPSFLAVGPDARSTVVAHELTHAAVARSTSGRTPSWLVEGLALYVSGDERRLEAARLLVEGTGTSLRRLSDPDVISTLSGEAQNVAYAFSSAAAYYIAERFGQAKLLDLYDVFNEESLRGRRGDPRLTDRATRRVLGVSLRRLDRDLIEWIGLSS